MVMTPARTGLQIRAITVFTVISADEDSWTRTIVDAAQLLGDLSKSLGDLKYTVQTLRIVTNPFGEYLNLSSEATALAGMKHITEILSSPAVTSATAGVRVRFAIGEARSVGT